MDREFMGKKWLQWLDDQDLADIVRIKKKVWVGEHQAGILARRPGRQKSARQSIFALTRFFASKSTRGSGRDGPLMVVSNRFSGKEALQIYRQGWGIERLFGHLKKNGFDLEATHMTGATMLEHALCPHGFGLPFQLCMGLSLPGKHPQNDCGSEPQKCLSLGSGRPHESVRSKQSRPISGGASERILAIAPVRNLPLNFPRVVCNPTKEAHHEVGRTDHDFTQHSVKICLTCFFSIF
jgi:hypothetical protein